MSAVTLPAEAKPSAGSRIAGLIGRQRELSLVVVMLALGAFVAIQAPQFVSGSNLTQVTVVASIIAIAAVGQAVVVITKNVDLSVEAMMGLVAFTVADLLKFQVLPTPLAMASGVLLGLLLGAVNGTVIVLFRVPAIVATLGTLSIYRGIDFLIAGGKQVTLGDLPEGYTDPARMMIGPVPLFVVIAVVIVAIAAVVMRQTTAGRRVYAVGSNLEAATILGVRSGRVIFAAFTFCGLMAGIAGVMWGINYGTINATAASGATLQVVAAVVVGGVNIAGGSGTVVGAGLGALFLALISNALLLLRLSQFWLQAIYGIVILVAVSLDTIFVRRMQKAAGGRRR
ncbi:MAG TPA: ABC transporter permease [Candidatus Limnocylindrales bacterium]|nr:ABC transporter permease [Candidatus Limnocylindrales bacterium]